LEELKYVIRKVETSKTGGAVLLNFVLDPSSLVVMQNSAWMPPSPILK
jgi:hypothetical protein